MTRALLSYALLAALLVIAGAHVALLVGLFRAGPRYRAWLALVLAPLAPYYGWMQGMRRRALAWLIALGAYVLGVVLANA